MRIIAAAAAATATAAVLSLGCSRDREGPLAGTHSGPRPEVMPVVANSELPFRYPTALYAQKVQGNVTLRLYIDAGGAVVPDSTRVVETSGYTALDSAAVRGSEQLTFVPAKRRGQPIPVSLLFPVYFRHPEAAPFPGDTVLQGPETQ